MTSTFFWSSLVLRVSGDALGVTRAGSGLAEWDRVHDGLGFLELCDRERAAQTSDPARLVATLGKAVVHLRPRVRPDRPGLDLPADPAADVDVVGENAGGEAQLGRVGAGDRIGLGVEHLKRRY